jgi:hypothetical protein
VYPARFIDEAGDIHQVYVQPSTKRIIAGDDVIHLHAGLSYDGMQSMDSVILHRDTFQRAATLDRYMTRFLTKGTVLRGAIEFPQGVDKDKAEETIHLLNQRFRGASADRDMLVLSDGAKLNNATLSPADSQLMQQGAYVTKQIAQITGVPPEFLYEMSDAKYNNLVDQMGESVVRYTFRPWIEQIEAELTTKLLTETDQDAGFTIHLDYTALIRGNIAAETTRATSLANAGLLTKNEVRASLNYPPSDDPEANKLKTLGDTAPPKPTPTPPVQNAAASGAKFVTQEKPHIRLSHFAEMVQDAADRVHKKTEKLIAYGQGKHKDNAQGWATWCIECVAGQTHYAATALAPVLSVYANLSGKSAAGIADKAAKTYGHELAGHLAAIGHGTASTAPDLCRITLGMGD